ncbi:MAG: 50S ribosomal protein L29 [Clostridia bacterium]|nr:50S ribosomal protein L29 [Clostridia bacterium]
MKAKDLREMTSAELEAKLGELKTELFNLRFQHATKQLENPMKLVEVRKDIAKVMTILHEKNSQANV